VIKREPPTFAAVVLRSLPVLVPSGIGTADLALELGLSACMQMSNTDVDCAIGQMWSIRKAVLEVSRLDTASEPVPFGGSSERLDLMNLALYLGNLVERAAAQGGCDADSIVAQALDSPIIQGIAPTAPEVWRLRSS